MYVTLLFAAILLASNTNFTKGALFRPEAYTLRGVEAVNGSSENGNCPSQCVTIISSTRTCFCGFGFEDQIDGVLINGGSSTAIDMTQRDGQGNFVWASQLFTLRRNTGSTGVGNITINFRFSHWFTLREVELYIFNCPAIGAQSITVNDAGGLFPSTLTSLVVDLSSETLSSDKQDCTALTRISIPIQNPQNERIFAIDFTTPYEWVHIGEVRFSDQLITTTPPPTTPPPTTQSPTTPPPTTPPPTTPPPTTQSPTTPPPTTPPPTTPPPTTQSPTTPPPTTPPPTTPPPTTQPPITSAPSNASMDETTEGPTTLMNLITTDAATTTPPTVETSLVNNFSSTTEQSRDTSESENRAATYSTTVTFDHHPISGSSNSFGALGS